MRGQWLRNVPAMRHSDKVLATKRCVWGNPQLLKGGYPGAGLSASNGRGSQMLLGGNGSGWRALILLHPHCRQRSSCSSRYMTSAGTLVPADMYWGARACTTWKPVMPASNRRMMCTRCSHVRPRRLPSVVWYIIKLSAAEHSSMSCPLMPKRRWGADPSGRIRCANSFSSGSATSRFCHSMPIISSAV